MPNETARETFVNNLHRLMSEQRITQIDIANFLHITPSTVSDWYLGKKYPRVDAMQLLADFFHVPMSSLTSEMPTSFVGEITEAERQLLLAYRAADDRAREDAMNTLLTHPREVKKGNLA